MTSTARPNLLLILALLILASAASVASTDLYTPSLPHLPAYFDTTPEMVKLTLTLNLLAFGAAQLVNGPLSDRIGRRPVLIGGMAGFTLFSLACAAAQSIEQLIGARVLLGLTASVESVMGLAIIHDLLDESERVRVFAIFGAIFAVVPALAPVLGGYVHVYFGWRANFALVFAVALVTTVLLWRFLPESSTPDPAAFRPARLLRDYGALLANRRFLGYTLVSAASLGTVFAFITAAPFVFIDRLGVATQHFGYYQASMVAAYVAGSLAANRLAGRLDPRALIVAGLAIALGGALLLPGVLALGLESAASLIAAIAVMTAGLGPVFAAAPALAMGEAGARAGVAAALFGALEMSVAGVASAMVAVMHDGTARPLAATAVLMALAAIGAFRLARGAEAPGPARTTRTGGDPS